MDRPPVWLPDIATYQPVTGRMANTWIFILLADYHICREWLGLTAPSLAGPKGES